MVRLKNNFYKAPIIIPSFYSLDKYSHKLYYTFPYNLSTLKNIITLFSNLLQAKLSQQLITKIRFTAIKLSLIIKDNFTI